MPTKNLTLEVEASLEGGTVASAARGLAGVSHSTAKGLVDQGLVRLNGRVVKDPVRRLAVGDRLEIRFDPGTGYRPRPERRTPWKIQGFSLLLEDDHLLVVDKEAGLITVPAPSQPDDSLADRLVAMYVARGVKTPRLWVVHRIDRFTSGLVLFARSAAAAVSLMEQFEQREAHREYLAICEGIPAPPQGMLVSWLKENPKSLKVAETRDRKNAQRAALSYRTEERLDNAALLRVVLETGRRNQIRVQFAGIGHPLVGDQTYGNPSPLIGRVALHAARLGFVHPHTGKPVRVESPIPADLTRLLRCLRVKTGGGRSNRVAT
ncbi:MAG TPA: RluA family pseudouridine synthase [Patescibacteria group bacterium]|nr:RluA family pseudouridine synthase [Patescibacteria group bacterium]